jgi:hypothetical protein
LNPLPNLPKPEKEFSKALIPGKTIIGTMRGRMLVCIVLGLLTVMLLSSFIGYTVENRENGLINNISNMNIETGLFPLDIVENPIRLTNNSYKDQKPQINDVGQVVWVGGGNPGSLDEI